MKIFLSFRNKHQHRSEKWSQEHFSLFSAFFHSDERHQKENFEKSRKNKQFLSTIFRVESSQRSSLNLSPQRFVPRKQVRPQNDAIDGFLKDLMRSAKLKSALNISLFRANFKKRIFSIFFFLKNLSIKLECYEVNKGLNLPFYNPWAWKVVYLQRVSTE